MKSIKRMEAKVYPNNSLVFEEVFLKKIGTSIVVKITTSRVIRWLVPKRINGSASISLSCFLRWHYA